jgi:hypothetical protein
VRLGGDPEAEALVQALGLGQVLLDLGQVLQAQVGVLQQHPVPLGRGRGHVPPRHHLLPLAHGHAQALDLAPLGQLLDELGGVRACSAAAAHRV